MWSLYVRTIVDMTTPHADQTTIAKRVGTTQGTISRWLGGRYLPDKAAIVAQFAQKYDRNVLEAFVAAGFIDAETAGRGLPPESAWLIASLSAAPFTVPDAMAAHPDQGDIAGEQERHHET